MLWQAALAVAERLAAAKSMATAIVRRRAKIMIVRAAAAIPKTTMKSKNVAAGLKIGLGRFDIVCSLQWDKRCRLFFFCFARMSFHNGFRHLCICFAKHTHTRVGRIWCVRSLNDWVWLGPVSTWTRDNQCTFQTYSSNCFFFFSSV